MRKNMCLLIIALLLCALLAACGHEHSWQDATCQNPKTCADCGATEGTVTDHNWQEATCQAPKTCVECGSTEGSALKHKWNEATCEVPKTCANCGTTKGEALGHDYNPWGKTEQDASGQWVRSRDCTICGDLQTRQSDGPREHGTAGFIEGTTLIVSIFADDLNTGWDFDNEVDRAARDLMLTNLNSAVDWLSRQVGVYGVESHFVCDWEVNPDLYYTHDFGERVLARGYVFEEEYVMDNIPSETLMEKYQAEDIIYMFYYNAGEDNTVRSSATADIHGQETEIIRIHVRNASSDGFRYTSAADFAHEIMHCFGAPDLYCTSEFIPQEYVDYLERTASMDIMFHTNSGSTVLHLLTPVGAYYMGLVDSCDEVDAWGLGKSSFAE